uniref:Cytochrome b5 heme-binding domain-containing protein n=1 Tax=Attheya septentrionalis TaxID=420275 RepID=A0A7S2UMK7_9STRA|mmetsp:Transcript_29765/g.54516  ORF Transcript_29765/g.54516 Transcript_29765/m.54516 type:complete len:226 (+) Transcript_29765:207-884(+)|eukprot:CAMPEP_0198280106 /NCGR_PEP_ID=MMETSP1449-20131203/259_1 /TAXON_ID=420275 /ORGANISM="Attheya septentrionalis, Strain CCMP2084" /LENGTH=225 /DNA_ID=CAMNT_0043975379 /DNA_START=171 /DNA_END=848 /DNA_ORIENTATION=+
MGSDNATGVPSEMQPLHFEMEKGQLEFMPYLRKDSLAEPETDSDSSVDSNVPCHIMSSPDHEAGTATTTSCCDACQYCEDICKDPFCQRCSKKSMSKLTKCSMGVSVRCGLGQSRAQIQPTNELYFTRCQLARHNHVDSAWLLVGDTIYDATKSVKNHPGGANSILRKSGGAHDCAVDLKFHSIRTQKLWKRNVIGKLRRCPCEDMGLDSDEISNGVSGEQCTIS